MKDVAGQALGMHAYEGRRSFDVDHHQGNSLFDAAIAIGPEVSAKAVDAELAPAGGKIRGSDLLDFVCAHCFIIAAGPAPAGLRAISQRRLSSRERGRERWRPAWKGWARHSSWPGGSASSPALPGTWHRCRGRGLRAPFC